jgi:DNA gyrase inhibitor GyrI
MEGIRHAWDTLEASVDLHGRHFYGAYDPAADDYRACVEVREGYELAPGLESGTLPGGRYLRARLQGEPPEVYARIGPTFGAMAQHATPDGSRPSLEHYRRRDEIDLLLPI